MRGVLMMAAVGVVGLACAAAVEAPRELTVLQEVDVLVLGGGSGAVQAAQKAAACGASVFLAAPRPYLGEDLAGTLRLRLAEDAVPQTALCKALYAAGAQTAMEGGAAGVAEANPLKVKKTFDAALLQAGVPFLTGCFATEPLLDADGRIAGAVVADKSGRQAVIAKVVIDATERAEVCRLAGAQARPFPAGTYTFSRMVIAGEAPKADGMTVKERLGLYGAALGKEKVQGRLFECEIALPMRDDSAASFAAAEQQARDMTFVPSVLDSSDRLFFVPPNPLAGEVTVTDAAADAAAVELRAFRPKGVPYAYVLGAMGDVPRAAARALMEPARSMTLGERIGAAAAAEAKARGALTGVRLAANAAEPAAGVRAQDIPGTISVSYIAKSAAHVPAEARALPELASCDVLVVGAGTGGAPAAIAAARQGAKVIVCEYLYHMGGVQTVGLIGGYYYGNIVGFTREIDAGVAKMAAVKVMGKSEWYRRQCRTNAAEIWYGTMATGAVREGDTLAGVIVVTPDGRRGVIRARAVIDGTGNADIAAAAGEETEYMRDDELAIQGAGNAPRRLGSSGANSDIGFVDETDAADLCFFALRSRVSLPATLWDQAQNVNSRERRRLVGAFHVSPLDVINRRTYTDTVMQSHSDLDSHGYTVHENFLIADFGRKKFFGANFPYRAMLPKRLDGLLVIGLGVSAHRDAMPVLRMQPDIQNEGYAAGYAAAMAVKAGVPLRAIDVKALQKHLVEIKNLDPAVLTAQDSYPLADARIREAVAGLADLTNHYEAVAVVLAEPLRAMPLLEAAYRQAGTEAARLAYAQVLGMMGNPLGGETLIAKVAASEWDAGWQFKGMSQFGRSVSWIDSYLIALGRSRVKAAFPAMRQKAEALTAESAFSHFRAVAMAFEKLGDPAAAPVLAAVLDKPGIRGNAFTLGPEVPEVPGHANAAADLERSKCLREIAVARALVRLGDHGGQGRAVLQAYAGDPRGVYARHAKAVLAERR